MTKLTRRTFAASAAAAAAAGAGLGFPMPALAQGYPARPVTVIVPWGAGGGTDATARIVAALLEKDLGQPFNVVNRTGGSGVVGHSGIATGAPDGYTIGMITVEITMMHWQGLTELNPKSYTPLALMNEDPPGVTVNSSSPYKTVKELADAIKAAPAGKLKASGTGQGGIWHLALVGWLKAMGLGAQSCRVGAVERRRARDAGSRGRRPRFVHLLHSGGARPYRGGQGAGTRPHGAGAQPGVQGHSDAQRSDGHRLFDRRVARHRWPEGAADRMSQPSSPPR